MWIKMNTCASKQDLSPTVKTVKKKVLGVNFQSKEGAQRVENKKIWITWRPTAKNDVLRIFSYNGNTKTRSNFS
jgi:hypothetical protein